MANDNLVTIESQTERSLTDGKSETRIFLKMYVSAVKHGLLADMGDSNWRTLCVIASFMDEDGNCYPTQSQIAKGLGVSRQAAGKRIRKLLDYRWQGRPLVTVSTPINTGQFSAYRYTLSSEYIVPSKDNPLAITSFKLPHSGDPPTDEQRVLTRNIPGYSKWVSQVKESAGFRCIRCGSREKLESHHINNYADYPEERTLLKNGACLCQPCHMKFHGIYGLTGTNRSHFNEFMNRGDVT